MAVEIREGPVLPRRDLQHLILQPDCWLDNHDMLRMFEAEPSKLTTAQPVKPVDKLAEKEATWGTHRDATMKEVIQLIAQGWVEAYTDGSAKQVWG